MVDYDSIFKNAEYNPREPEKIKLVQGWLNKNKFSFVLDIGCGRGHYLRKLSPRLNIAGLEPSKYVCDTELKGLWIYNTDILGYKGRAWDGLYCMDVLEHLQDIDQNLTKLVSLAPMALFGIANHPDRWGNNELHLVQEGAQWWHEKLLNNYKVVDNLYNTERYFIFEAKNV